jgi:hypothetical protein
MRERQENEQTSGSLKTGTAACTQCKTETECKKKEEEKEAHWHGTEHKGGR